MCGAREGTAGALGGVILLHSHAGWLFDPDLLANEAPEAWRATQDGLVCSLGMGRSQLPEGASRRMSNSCVFLCNPQPPASLTSGTTA